MRLVIDTQEKLDLYIEMKQTVPPPLWWTRYWIAAAGRVLTVRKGAIDGK